MGSHRWQWIGQNSQHQGLQTHERFLSQLLRSASGPWKSVYFIKWLQHEQITHFGYYGPWNWIRKLNFVHCSLQTQIKSLLVGFGGWTYWYPIHWWLSCWVCKVLSEKPWYSWYHTHQSWKVILWTRHSNDVQVLWGKIPWSRETRKSSCWLPWWIKINH